MPYKAKPHLNDHRHGSVGQLHHQARGQAALAAGGRGEGRAGRNRGGDYGHGCRRSRDQYSSVVNEHRGSGVCGWWSAGGRVRGQPKCKWCSTAQAGGMDRMHMRTGAGGPISPSTRCRTSPPPCTPAAVSPAHSLLVPPLQALDLGVAPGHREQQLAPPLAARGLRGTAGRRRAR